MVNFTDLKYYESTGKLGGAITGNAIQTATPNNLFVTFLRSEIVAGSTKYKCFYLKNESAEDMENFKIWISNATPLSYTSIAFGFDVNANPFDGAVGFDGISNYVDCTNDATLWSKDLAKFSFSVEIYPTAAGDGNDRYVVSHGGAVNNGFRLIIDQTDDTRIKFRFTDSGGTVHTVSSYELQKNQWNHIICSFDNSLVSDNMVIFHNGIQQEAHDFTGTLNLSATLTLADASNDFKGYMRDFQFWNNSRVSAAEALELYENNEITDDPPSYHLQFGERTGSTTKDAVSKTKVATFNGTFWKLNAQGIADTFTAPTVYNDNWYGVNEKPNPFKIKTGLYVPIWVRVICESDTTATPVLDDYGIFSIKFDITPTGTGSSGSGGTGGGSGGDPTTTSDWKIAIAGDWGNTGDTTDVLNLIKDQDYDFVIGVGDNAYDDSSASSWCSKFNVIKDKFDSAFGNHEYDDGPINTYKSFFGYSSTHKAIKWQNILFIIMDDNDFEDSNAPSLDSEKTWAKGVLDQYKNDTGIVWRIVVTHHPPFGTGGKHPANEGNQVQKWLKMFTDYDVNFWYCGHNHNWQRTHQVAYNPDGDSSDGYDPSIVDSSSPYSRVGNGLINVVTGTGGHDSGGNLYSLFNDANYWAYRNKSNNGVHELVASNQGKTLTGRFRNIDNNTSDTFVINA